MKLIIAAFFIIFQSFYYCQATPAGFTVMEEVTGDLDKDSIPEKVIVYNTSDSTELGTKREIHIFKKTNSTWALWKKSKNAIRSSDEGGVMGDPYGFIEIKKGILIIGHAGGSNWKWNYTDKYRLKNGEFELIGFSYTEGQYCHYFNYIDFNIVTGKYNYKKEYFNCTEDRDESKVTKTEIETCIKKGIKLTLNNRNSQEIRIVTKKYKYAFSI
jgi:hypothetical protein